MSLAALRLRWTQPALSLCRCFDKLSTNGGAPWHRRVAGL